MIFFSGRGFDSFKIRNLGVSKIVNTIFVISFAIVDVLGRDGCVAVFFHVSTCSPPLPCNTHKEGRANVQALPSSRGDPWETVKFESCGGAKRPKHPRASLGESLDVCISARIPLPQIKLTFINVYGGT